MNADLIITHYPDQENEEVTYLENVSKEDALKEIEYQKGFPTVLKVCLYTELKLS